MDGIIVIKKELGCTSRDVVNQACSYLKTKKIGHTGTLDPMATGVLVLCVGKATKLVETITSYDKEYIAEVTLGIETDTLDITGKVIKEENVHILREKIETCLKQMVGFYNQTVPIYSAVKVKGKKLYEYARNNEKVNLPTRRVEIKSLELMDDIIYKNNKTIFKIKCNVSKGTYIRSLVKDIASSCHTIGTMSMLIRTRQGAFEITNANTLDDVKNHTFKIYSIEEVLHDFYKIEVSNELYFKIKNGSIVQNIYHHDIIVFLKNKKVIAIYKKYDKNPNFIKPWKMFL